MAEKAVRFGSRFPEISNKTVQPKIPSKQLPTSLHEARAQILQDIKKCSSQLQEVERSFYAEAGDEETYLMQLAPHVNALLSAARMSEFRNLDLITQYTSGDIRTAEQSASQIQKSVQRVMQVLPPSFDPLVAQISNLQQQCHKYCSSFYRGQGREQLLESVTHYTRRTTELHETVSNNLARLTSLPTKFRSAEGIVLSVDFSLTCQQLAQRCNVLGCPHLLLFCEACERIRNCLRALTKWLQADAEYVSFLQCDIEELEKKVQAQETLVKTSNKTSLEAQFKFNKIKEDIKESSTEMDLLREKEPIWLKQQAQMIRREKTLHIDLHVKRTSLDTLARTGPSRQDSRRPTSTAVVCFNRRLQQLTHEVAQLKQCLPRAELQLMTVNRKLEWVEQKRKRLLLIQSLCKQLESELQAIHEEEDADHFELARMRNHLQLLRHILTLKTSKDIFRKLVHDQFIPLKPDQSFYANTDELDTACQITAQYIKNDWVLLYKTLPFTPSRGQANVDSDLAEVSNQCLRLNLQKHCKQALKRWRRHHTDPQVDDLVFALKKIKRPDVVKRVQRATAKKTTERKQRPKPNTAARRRRAAWVLQYQERGRSPERNQLRFTHSRLRYSMGRVSLNEHTESLQTSRVPLQKSQELLPAVQTLTRSLTIM